MTKNRIIGAEGKHFRSNGFIRLRNKLLSLEDPLLMGIVNATPDSFYDASRISDHETLKSYLNSLVTYGFSMVDLGANSTRPGSRPVSATEQIKRLEPVLKFTLDHYPSLHVSIDTSSAEVAAWALSQGADLINDVEGGNNDPDIWGVCASFNAPYVLTHSRGKSSNVHDETTYDNVTTRVLFELSQKINQIQAAGVKDILIDPGFGFSKDLQQNYEMLKHLTLFQIFERPILCGFSRKSMIYKKLNTDANEALNGTTILNTFAITKGCDVLRVHDARAAHEVITLLKM
ncbi:MAG: dihydropteroate synthase [Flavobacteriales bacterium]